MGHFSTAEMLLEAGADPSPPDGLCRNSWDPEDLRNIVKNLENYNDPEYLVPSLLDDAAVQFINMGQISNAEEMYRRALEGYEKVFGVEYLWTLDSIHKLASVLQDQGKHEMAEEMYRRALAGYEKIRGVKYFMTLKTASDLASVLQNQGKYEAAEEMKEKRRRWESSIPTD